jgi:hypothetical protein
MVDRGSSEISFHKDFERADTLSNVEEVKHEFSSLSLRMISITALAAQILVIVLIVLHTGTISGGRGEEEIKLLSDKGAFRVFRRSRCRNPSAACDGIAGGPLARAD